MKEKNIVPVVVFMVFILGFSVDLYTPSFPSMSKIFATTNQLIQLTITTYFLGYVSGQLVFGPLMDAVGRKKPLLSGLLFYILMSFSAAFAPSITILLLLRFFQGVGVSFVGVGFRSILVDSLSGKKLANAFNYTTMSYRIAPIVAPFLGGFLEVYFGWASNFYFLAAFGIVILMTVLLFLPETHFDRHPFRAKTILANYKKVLRYPILLGAGFCIGITYATMVIFNLIGPFFIQDVLHFSPIVYGNIALIVGVAALSGSILNRIYLHRFAVENLIRFGVLGFFAMTVAQVIFSLFFPQNLYCFIIPVIATLGISGFITSNMMSKALETVPGSKGTASATMGILIMLTVTITTALTSYLKAETIIPFAFSYLIAAALLLILYLFVFRRKNPSPDGA